MLALSAGVLSNNQQINVASYSTQNDGGGGVFVWNSTSTATPDGGIAFAPTGSLTAVSSASMATGNGSTLTFSGTFAHGIINPGSVSVTGSTASFADDGAGNLLVSGLPSGTINYTTGAWTLTFATAPSGAITGSYNYAASAGRWLRQFSGNVNALWWGLGAKTIAGTDATPTIQAANNYAYANSLGLEVSAPPGHTSINTSYAITLTARYVNAMPAFGSDSTAHGVSINFSAAGTTDLYPAFVASGEYGQRIRGVYVVGTSTNNLFSNPSLSVLASNGAINTATLGDLSVYTTVAPYSAFASGPVAFSLGGSSSQPVFENCGSRNLKFSLVLDSTNGHTNSVDCNWSGSVAGVYLKTNAESYIFRNGTITGSLASVLLGDTLYAGHYGGISGNSIFQNIDFGFGPYAFLQVHDNSSAVSVSNGVIETLFLNCGFESIGEAAFRLLPSGEFSPQFVNCNPPGYPGSYSSTYNLPAAFTMSNGHAQFWAWAGTIGQLKWDSWGVGAWGYSAVGGVLQGVLIYQGFAGGFASYTNQYGTPLRPGDWSFLNGLAILVNSSGTALANPQPDLAHPNFLNPQSRLPEATKNVLSIRRDFSPQKNLLINPETSTNWSNLTSGNTVAVSSYSALSASLPAVTAMPPDMLQELGANPNVIQISTGTATSFFAQLNFVGSPVSIAHPTNVGVSFWIYCPQTASFRQRLQGASNTYMYDTTISGSAAAGWVKIWHYGQNFYQNTAAASDAYYWFQLFSSGTWTASESVFVAGVMAFVDEVTAYNPYNGPTADAPVGLSSYASASLPPAANFQLGTHTFCTNGRNTGEGSGVGTGCPVFVKSVSGTNTWCAVWSGVAVTT